MKKRNYIFLFYFLILSLFSCSDDDNKEDENQLPEITIVNPAKDANLTKGDLTDIIVTVTGNEKINFIRYFIDNIEYGYLEQSPYNFVWDTGLETVSLGSHVLNVEAECSSGKMIEKSISVNIVEPTLTIITPQEGENLVKGNVVEISVSVSTNGAKSVGYFINGIEQEYLSEMPYNFSWDTGETEFVPGTYNLTVKVFLSDDIIVEKTIVVNIVEPELNFSVSGLFLDRLTNNPLSGFSISLSDIYSTSNSSGEFSFENILLEKGFYTLNAEGTSEYIPVMYGFDLNESKTEEVKLYAYPKEPNIQSKGSDFIKGVSLFDAGPWMDQDLYPDDFVSTFEKLNNMNANTVTVFDPVFVTVAGNDTVKMSTAANTYYQWDMLDTDQYSYLTGKAKDQNLNFMWWFGVWPQEEEQLDGKSFNEIAFSGQTLSDHFWEDWFNEYSRILKEYAALAESEDVKYISLGHGLSYATSPSQFSSIELYVNHWSQLINEIRSVYTGKILYFGTCRPFTATNYEGGTEVMYYEDESYSDDFMDLFDAFGLILSNITQTNNPEVTDVKSSVTSLLNRYSAFKKPIILWVWTPSADGSANLYGHLEPVLDVSNASRNYTQDFYEQADVYEGIMQAVNETSVDVLGIISHGYMYHDRFDAYEPRSMETAFNKAASVRGKPAEEILKYWFGEF